MCLKRQVLQKFLLSMVVNLCFVLMVSNPSAAQISSSFSVAKKKLYQQVYGNKGKTFYVNCRWSRKKTDLRSCHLENRFKKTQRKRALRTEVEHVIPASWFFKVNGQFRRCYLQSKQSQLSARRYCQKTDSEYRNAHNDLVNLRPAVGAINAYRSNKPFSDKVSGGHKMTFRGDGMLAVITTRLIIPDISIRGDIARIAFYMRKQYGLTYSHRQQLIFNQWHLTDPVSTEEQQINARISQIQGRANPYVDYSEALSVIE